MEAALKIYMPAPNAMPMPTVAQIPAAVVMPITFMWRVKMTPAPVSYTHLDVYKRQREEIGLERIFLTLQQMEKQKSHKLLAFVYEGPVERAIGMLEPAVEWATKGEENTRWFCARLLDANSNLLDSMEEYLGYSLVEDARCG